MNDPKTLVYVEKTILCLNVFENATQTEKKSFVWKKKWNGLLNLDPLYNDHLPTTANFYFSIQWPL